MLRAVLLALLLTACSPTDSPDSGGGAPVVTPVPVPDGGAGKAVRDEPTVRLPRTVAEKRCMRYLPLFVRASKEAFGVDDYTALLMAQAMQESTCDPNAKSPVGANGLDQFMYTTALDMIKRGRCTFLGNPRSRAGVEQLMLNPEWSARCGARYMADLIKFVKKYWTGTDAYMAALACFNGGCGWIVKERKKALSKGEPDVYCNSTRKSCIRSAANCKENNRYPVVIFTKRLPPLLEMGVAHNGMAVLSYEGAICNVE